MEQTKIAEQMKVVKQIKEGGWKVLGWFLFVPLGYYSNGYAGSHLWNWFIVPQFPVHSLTISQAIALACVTSFFCKKPRYLEKDEKAPSFWVLHSRPLMWPWLCLFFAYILKHFITV